MKLQKLLLLILAVGLAVWAISDVAWAQRGRVGVPGAGQYLQYVVKFVCGPGASASAEELAPGIYYTIVNIHNPNHDKQHVVFLKKIALDGDKPQRHGLVSSPQRVQLGFDEALQINCSDIYRIAEVPAKIQDNFIKGFVVLYTRDKLDVQAVYTTCSPKGGTCAISSIHMAEGLVKPSPVPAPAVVFKGLSVSASSLKLSLEPFSPLAYDGVRLMVYDLNGRMVHDTGYVAGTELSWRPLSAGERPLANGVYFYVVEVRDVLGQVARKVGKFTLLR